MTTILIVDDEPGVRDLLRDAMEIAGYQTEVATNGAEALDLLRRHNADLCIVDINMPTMDGFEFLAKLREHDTQTPVLMLSARDSPVDVAKGLRFGADDYVRKPFSLEEILLRISAILRRSNSEAACFLQEARRLSIRQFTPTSAPLAPAFTTWAPPR